jgi:hypothetical protein
MKKIELMPGYFDKRVFRSAFVLILILCVYTIYSIIQNNSMVQISCNDIRGCSNPFYVCTEEDAAYNSDPTNYFYKVPCIDEAPWFISNKTLTETRKFENGFVYGPNNFIVNNSNLILFYIILTAVIVNALLYKRKTGSWKYKEGKKDERTREDNKGSSRVGNEQLHNKRLHRGDSK